MTLFLGLYELVLRMELVFHPVFGIRIGKWVRVLVKTVYKVNPCEEIAAMPVVGKVELYWPCIKSHLRTRKLGFKQRVRAARIPIPTS